MLLPKNISRPLPHLLTIEWNDGFSATIPLEKLRDECPCAMCKGEQIMGQPVSFGIKMFAPGMNELEKLVPVGNYGIQASWKDGHDTGIYPWQLLRRITEQYNTKDNPNSQSDASLNGTSKK
ncbi:MAG: DUF971 domain-containing protein [Ignavibacteriae bacterium]|nr:DUF971 domain-containing protein [Ignavibacteriota bacterium]